MSSIHIRPRFKERYKMQPSEVIDLIELRISKLDCGCSAIVRKNFIIVRIRPDERHFWSPQLSLSFEVDEEDDSFTIIRGLYGPNPTVWALFTYGYVALGILFTFLGMYGFSKYSLGQDHTVLWSLPILAGLALVLYIIAQFGQKLGAEQMFTLHHVFEDSVGHRIHLE